jgi:DNA-binding beta-propeller fold protein YncE
MLDLNSGISSKIAQVSNISKIGQSGKYLFILSRSNNELVVFDLDKQQELTKIKVGQKPVDLEILGKKGEIYVLSAGSDELNIINMKDFTVKKTIALNSGGFPGKITVLEGENKALITNQDAYQIVIYDMVKEKILGYLPISKDISFLQVSR